MEGTMRERRSGVWEITLNLGRDAQGIRRRRTVTFRGNKTQAARRMRELVAEFDRGQLPPPKIRLDEWLDRWMAEHIVPNRSVGTAERYEGVIRKHIGPALGHRELARLTPMQIQQWENDLLRQGIPAASIGLMHTVLSGAYRYALRMELVPRNPTAAVSPPTIQDTETYTPDVAVVNRLLHTADELDARHAPVFRLLAYTGLRLGEALALTWENVNLDEGWLLVTQSLGRRRGSLMVSSPKTASGNRKVDLDARTVRLLREHRSRQDERQADLVGYWDDRGIVFPDSRGGWLNPSLVTRQLQTLSKRIGSPNITSRSLRHFHATVLLQAGVNPVIVSKRLGHANVSITTDVYAHALPGWQGEAAARFADVMAEAGPAARDDGIEAEQDNEAVA